MLAVSSPRHTGPAGAVMVAVMVASVEGEFASMDIVG